MREEEEVQTENALILSAELNSKVILFILTEKTSRVVFLTTGRKSELSDGIGETFLDFMNHELSLQS